MMKRILSVLLAVCLLAVCLPLSASAEVLEGSCGEDAEWVLNTATGVLTISGTGPMKDAAYVDDTPWADYKSKLRKVVVNSGITHIGTGAFDMWASGTMLTTVELPNTVTSIGERAFRLCGKMTNCVLPDGITSIGESAFSGCNMLKLTKFPSSLTSLGTYAFNDCASIGPVIEFPHAVTTIPDYGFNGCTGIKKLTLHEGIGDIGKYAFHATSIQKLVIPSTAKAIGSAAFEDCKSLRFVDMKGGTSLGSFAFSNCSALEKINFPDTLVKVAPGYSGFVFYNCSKLTYLYFPASVETINFEATTDSLRTVCIVNPECEIRRYPGAVGKTTIYGEPDSTAEAYAKKNGYSFKLLGTQPNPPADPVINDDITNPDDPDPVDPSAPKFTDVPADAFYAEPVAWAVKNDITSGTSNTTFEPNKTCDRGQIVTFLWRANGSPKMSSTKNPFQGREARGLLL